MSKRLISCCASEMAALDRGYRFVDGSFFVVSGSPYTLANLWDE